MIMTRLLQWCIVFCMCQSVALHASDMLAMSSAQLLRYERLATQLRCLVCDNQSIADSQAPLAGDIRRRLKQQILQGMSDDAIKQFYVQRYGEYILYQPRLSQTTLFLWLAPLCIVLIIMTLWWRSLSSNEPT